MRLFFSSATFLCLLCICQLTQAKVTQAIGQKTYAEMQEVQALVEEKRFAEADAQLQNLLEKKRLNDYEKAQVWAMIGNIAFQKEDFGKAIQAFENAITSESLPDGFVQITFKTLAQLTFIHGDAEKARSYVEKLIASQAQPDATSLALAAQIEYRLENLDAALAYIEKAIALNPMEKPPENWLLVKNAIHYDQKNYREMIHVLETLVQLYPKEAYLKNLAAIHAQLGDTEKQLLYLEPLYETGGKFLEAELVHLARLMLMHKVPYKGALIIEKGFQDQTIKRSEQNLTLLAQSWQLAAEEEKSITYLTELAKAHESGDHFIRLAQAHINLYQWQQAETALEKAIPLLEPDEQANNYILLGMVRFYQKHYHSAKKAFRKARKEKSTLASQWLVYMDQEIEKLKAAGIESIH